MKVFFSTVNSEDRCLLFLYSMFWWNLQIYCKGRWSKFWCLLVLQKEWNGIWPTTGSGSSNGTPCPTFNFVGLHHSGFQDSQQCVRDAAGCIKNNKLLWHFPQHRNCVDFLSGLTSAFVQTSFVFPQKKRLINHILLLYKRSLQPFF